MVGDMRSIEDRYGVDDPGYQPPVREPVEIVEPDPGRPLSVEDGVWIVFVPIWGVVMAVKYFTRERVGLGLASLLLAAVGFAAWSAAASLV